MPRIGSRTLVACAAFLLIVVFVGAEAFGSLPLGGTAPSLSPPANLSVSAPSVSAPSLPHVSTPSAPSVSAPSVSSLPSSPSLPGARSLLGRVGGSAGGAAGSVSGVAALVPRAAAGSPAAGVGGASGSAGYAAGSPGGGSGSSAGGGSDGGAHRASASRATPPPEYRGRDGERRLRADVRRMASCLGALPSLERRVLAARAGIGTAALSRSDAAEHLHISREREIAVERRGIEDLKSAAHAGGCPAESGPATLSARRALIGAHLAAVPQLQPGMLLSGRPSLKTPVALAGPPGRALSGVEAASASGGSSTLASGSAQLAGAQPTIAHPEYLVALLLAAILVGGVALLRRRREWRRAYAPALPDDVPVLLETRAEPIEVSWTSPVEPRDPEESQQTELARDPNGARPGAGARRAAVIAAGLASLAITGMLRRRR